LSQNEIPPHFVVIVPGYMGSKLRDKTTGKVIWIDLGAIPTNPLKWKDWVDYLFEAMTYPNDNLEPAGIVDEVLFLPPWVKQEEYGRLIEALEGMGYQADPSRYSEEELDVYTFAYDWRQDNRISARQLGEAIERWSAYNPGAQAWLIGHSNGGIVSRWYIEKEGGKDRVGKLILMGSPWDGAPKGMRLMFSGLGTLFRRRFDLFDIPKRTRDMIRTFPSAYQLIPVVNPFLRDANNELVDPFSDTNWLDSDEQRQLLLDGRHFNEELGTTLSVDTLCFFGRKLPTQTYGVVRFEAGGRWSDIEWHATEAGDGTVPERSAIHPNAKQKLPFVVDHGDIYVAPAVLEFLKWELIDQYRQAEPERAVLVTSRQTIVFEPEQDFYAPGETIDLWMSIHDNESQEPVSEASIRVALDWVRPLPGEEPVAAAGSSQETRLWESEATAGRYEGSFEAPETEGYYRLTAIAEIPTGPSVQLTELIAIEK
jgi:pimeloyl-ACP methyl ester carboxylesterase